MSSLQPWECGEGQEHACPLCRPAELALPDHLLGEHHISPRLEWRNGTLARMKTSRLTVNGIEIPWFLEVVAGADGWVDACTLTPGVQFPSSLHMCPCRGCSQCRRRFHGVVQITLRVPRL